MLLKFEGDPDDLYLVEATGNRGVALNKWQYLREHVGDKQFYKRVVHRHVEFDRQNEKVDQLEQFLKESLGKKYGLNMNKLSRKKTVIKKQNANIIDDDRDFFCSELVAKAFKVLGILEDNDTSCAGIMPHHFGKKGESVLKLTPDSKI